MNRKEKTDFLRNLLINEKLAGRGKYWSSEVTIDYGSINVKRVDFMQFEPQGVIYTSDIEKAIFTCYEVKSCREDVFSGNGLNFLGEKNYIVTTMECYKSILPDLRNGKLWQHIQKCNPESSPHFGFIVPVPYMTDITDEFETPTELNKDIRWELKVIYPCRQGYRKKSTIELLFCMLRSKKEYTL